MKKYDFNNDKMWKTFLEFNNRYSIFSKKINENKVKNIINDLYNKIIQMFKKYNYKITRICIDR